MNKETKVLLDTMDWEENPVILIQNIKKLRFFFEELTPGWNAKHFNRIKHYF